MTGSTVCGVLNCSVSHAVTPSFCTCWIRLVVGPKVVWSSSRAAAVSLIGDGIPTGKELLRPPLGRGYMPAPIDCLSRCPRWLIWADDRVVDT